VEQPAGGQPHPMPFSCGLLLEALVWPKESAISRCRWNGAGFSFTDDAARTIEMHIQIAKRWNRKRLEGFKWGGVCLQHGEKIKNIC